MNRLLAVIVPPGIVAVAFCPATLATVMAAEPAVSMPDETTSCVAAIVLPPRFIAPPLTFKIVVLAPLSPCVKLPAMDIVPPLTTTEPVLLQSATIASPVSLTMAEPLTTNEEPLLLAPSETATWSSPIVSEPPEMVAVLAPPPEVVL